MVSNRTNMRHCQLSALMVVLIAFISPAIAQSSPANLANLDILVVDGDTLVRGVAATNTDVHPGDVTFIGDGSCKIAFVLPFFTCAPNFCSVQTIAVAGTPIQASPDIDCSGVQSCSETHTQSVTVSSSKAVTGGISASNGDVISKAIKATANLGGTYTWSDAEMTGTSFSFTPKAGDKGHIVFVPYMLEACGTYYRFIDDIYCTVDEYIPMTCAQTPYRIGSGEPAGVFSWCSDNGAGCGT